MEEADKAFYFTLSEAVWESIVMDESAHPWYFNTQDEDWFVKIVDNIFADIKKGK
jgi:hypothetical protein